MTIRTLQREARRSAMIRGHELGKWRTTEADGRSISTAACIRRKLDVQCNTRPLPNGIDIGGPAVARNCPNPNQGA